MRIISLLRRFARIPQTLLEVRDGIANEHASINLLLEAISDLRIGQAPTNAFPFAASAMADFDAGVAGLPGETTTQAAKTRSQALPPYPIVDLSGAPIQQIMAAAEFEQCAQMLEATGRPQESLMSSYSQALLYCLVRNMRPDLVVEIGTYRAGTAEAICRALSANNAGVLRTVDPFGAQTVPKIVGAWPLRLRDRIRFHPMSSMDFFTELTGRGQRSDIVLVDGNHDYEFALFDIEAAARIISPGGFVFVDNISQAGPYLAAQDFLSRHAGWIDCAGSLDGDIAAQPFDPHRAKLRNTDFCVLRAPSHLLLTERPYCPGQIKWPARRITGLAIEGEGEPGRLNCQCVVRTFGDSTALQEKPVSLSAAITPGGETRLVFEDPPSVEDSVVSVTVEPWLSWQGSSPLRVDKWRLF